jgi:hypothetical protein
MKPVLKSALFSMTALLVGFAAFEPASSPAAQKRLSETLEQALPSLASVQDYWTASKVSFELAGVRSRLSEMPAACEALSQSLDYYRKAVANDTDTPLYEFSFALEDDEGMREVRARTGCVGVTV